MISYIQQNNIEQLMLEFQEDSEENFLNRDHKTFFIEWSLININFYPFANNICKDEMREKVLEVINDSPRLWTILLLFMGKKHWGWRGY